ncbi:c-type cytochrome [Aureivirga sp. CE67]|uniref:c-type cytochrome n=1 Tax=Aureivirga sp. CE67 TaxID=1788983 RepID=UPI0018CB22F7|nr:c-type cytochrome [Aureivirga sp. CE67]
MKLLLKFILLFTIISCNSQNTLIDKKVDEKGNVLREIHKKNNSDTLLVKEYFENGKIRETYESLNGLDRNGKSITYYENGNVLFEQFYKNNKLDNFLKCFYPNGKLQRVEKYKSDFHIDSTIFYNKKGEISQIKKYKELCKFGNNSCNISVVIYNLNSPVYSYEIINGLKSENHTIIDEVAYNKLMNLDNKTSAIVKGEKIFNNNCMACHRLENDFIGPKLNCILEKKSKQAIINKISNSNTHHKSKLTKNEIDLLIDYLKEKCQ